VLQLPKPRAPTCTHPDFHQTRIRGLLGVGSDPSRPTNSIRISGSVGDAEELPYCFVVVAEVWTSEAHD
jgi:hypothetical protein